MSFLKPDVPQAWSRRALILACAILVASPLVLRGVSCGHDFDFHLQSWLAVAQHWQHGNFYPHWIEGSNYGAGEPRFVFYPPLSWMLGALLGTIFPWIATPAAFTLVVMAACGFAMHKLAREWLPPDAATLAACAYILNPYALFVAYERTAYGELAAGIWLPLIVLYALRSGSNHRSAEPDKSVIASAPLPNKSVILSERLSASRMDLRSLPASTNPGAPRRAIVTNSAPLALSIAGVWLSNAPAAVMSCYLLAAIALWTAIRRKSWKPILHATTGLVLGLGLAAFYILPAAYERRWVDITRALSPGVRIQDGFLFSHIGPPFHDAVVRTISWIFVAMVATIVFSCGIARARAAARHMVLPLFVTGAVLFLLQLPITLPIWYSLPELKFLQFPWRLTLVLSVAFAMAMGAAVVSSGVSQTTRRFRLTAAAILLAALAIVPAATKLFWQYCDEEDAVTAQVQLFEAATGFEGTDEYATLGADNSIIQQVQPPVRVLRDPQSETATDGNNDADRGNPTYESSAPDEIPAKINVNEWLPEQKTFAISTPTPGYAVLRLLDYPAWQIRANRIEIATRPHRADGLVTIPVQPGTTQIEIRYKSTADVLWGRSISTVSLLILIVTAATGRKRRRVDYHGANAS